MPKKTEDNISTPNTGHYYTKEFFESFSAHTHIQKKPTQEITNSTFSGETSYTETLIAIKNLKEISFFEERMSWYEAIEAGNLKPWIDSTGNVRLRADSQKNSQHEEWCQQIETIASKWLERESYEDTDGSRTESINSILSALGQLTRYLPDLQKKQPNYFLDIETHKIGVTIQNEGTLTLLIGSNSEVEYSYAQRQEKGTVRISGIAKLTTNIKNSRNIWKILNLQGIVK